MDNVTYLSDTNAIELRKANVGVVQAIDDEIARLNTVRETIYHNANTNHANMIKDSLWVQMGGRLPTVAYEYCSWFKR